MTLPTPELLTAVLTFNDEYRNGINITSFKMIGNNIVFYWDNTEVCGEINKHAFAFECKEWARKKYGIEIMTNAIGTALIYLTENGTRKRHIEYEISEPDVIFKFCNDFVKRSESIYEWQFELKFTNGKTSKDPEFYTEQEITERYNWLSLQGETSVMSWTKLESTQRLRK